MPTPMKTVNRDEYLDVLINGKSYFIDGPTKMVHQEKVIMLQPDVKNIIERDKKTLQYIKSGEFLFDKNNGIIKMAATKEIIFDKKLSKMDKTKRITLSTGDIFETPPIRIFYLLEYCIKNSIPISKMNKKQIRMNVSMNVLKKEKEKRNRTLSSDSYFPNGLSKEEYLNLIFNSPRVFFNGSMIDNVSHFDFVNIKLADAILKKKLKIENGIPIYNGSNLRVIGKSNLFYFEKIGIGIPFYRIENLFLYAIDNNLIEHANSCKKCSKIIKEDWKCCPHCGTMK